MDNACLHLPDRTVKPRQSGLTMIVDGGIPTRYFIDVVESAAEHIDFVKFGWGTALVTADLGIKVDALRRLEVDYYFGGTLFEKFVLQRCFEEFRELCQSHACRYVEVSNGTIELSNSEKSGYIRKLAGEFEVISEVGFKDQGRSSRFSPDRWVECMHEDIDSGATIVTLESRESGRSGICRPDGSVRHELIDQIMASDIPAEKILFEAPTTDLQSYFVKRIGANVNLGNVPVTSVLNVETLRLGLRSDTLLAMEPGAA